MKLQSLLVVLVVAVLGGLVARELWPKIVTTPGIPVIVTDTIYVDHFDVDTIIEIRDRVITDTVTLTYQTVISDPVLVPCPDLPHTRGITRLTAGQGFDDTTKVAIVDVWSEGQQIAVQQSVEKLYTPGPLLYLEATDPVRYDFGQWPVQDECGFGCKLLWYAVGIGTGAVVWELAR